MGLSEIVALAFGLLIGSAAGVGLVSTVRARPRPPREVRLTITPNDLPRRRAATLAVDHNRSNAAPLGRGGPADPITLGVVPSAEIPRSPIRTDVHSDAGRGALVAFPVPHGRDPELDVLREPVPARAAGAVALAELPTPEARREPADHTGGAEPAAAVPRAATGPCADERRIASERCDLADRLSEQATAANQRLREQQRAYDDLAVRAAQAAVLADPREIRSSKEVARLTFRRAHAEAHSREAVESAAADWLDEINRINQAARDAATEGSRARDHSAQLALAIERLGLEADVARINAESASEACQQAREALAACEEAQVDRRAGRAPIDPAATPVAAARPKLIGGPELEPGEMDEITPPAERAFAGAQPRILRMLRGDGQAIRTVALDLAGDDLDEQGRWQLLLSSLVDACVARAIEASSLEFPVDHGFWSPFSQAQGRDIATALASLGYRFDGLGGFADGRIPSQRDLSLALGYAGLDPMRLRFWPNEATMPHLFDDVRVAADEYVAANAGDLTLGEMIALLRGRAEPLSELWNHWGRIRPLLLEA